MLMPIIPQAGLGKIIVLDYDGDYADVDIFAAAGSPADKVKVIVNMASGTDFYASTTGNNACDCNGFTSDSTVVFNMIDSNISGAQGAGGAGSAPASGNGSAGGAGGTGLRLGCPTEFNETGTSSINGGGGGGGSRAMYDFNNDPESSADCQSQDQTGGLHHGSESRAYHFWF